MDRLSFSIINDTFSYRNNNLIQSYAIILHNERVSNFENVYVKIRHAKKFLSENINISLSFLFVFSISTEYVHNCLFKFCILIKRVVFEKHFCCMNDDNSKIILLL